MNNSGYTAVGSWISIDRPSAFANSNISADMYRADGTKFNYERNNMYYIDLTTDYIATGETIAGYPRKVDWNIPVPSGTSPGDYIFTITTQARNASQVSQFVTVHVTGGGGSQKLIGADAADTSDANNAADYFVLTKFTATGTGNMTEFKLNCSAAGNVKVAVYSDNGGEPNALLNSVGTTAVVTGWNTIAFPSTALISGTNYWLAFNSDTSVVGAKLAFGIRRFKPMAFATAFPASAGTGFTNDTAYYALTAGWGN